MATQKEVGQTYNPMDKIFELMLGDFADITNSLPGSYGEPSIDALRLAQEKKHEKYFKQLGLFSGATLLDIGCGWAPFLNYCRTKGVEVTGLTLSTVQYKYCLKHGFNVVLSAWQDFTPIQKFDAVSAVGSIEHFPSRKDYQNGRQDTVYRDLMEKVAKWLKPEGTFGGQFMTWNGDIPNPDMISTKANQNSREYHLALLDKFYPGSWLPKDFDSFFQNGDDLFEKIEVIDGRVQYIWTMRCWGRQFRKLFPLVKWWYVLPLLVKTIFDKDFRLWARAFWKKSNQLCFERGWMGHEFFFLRKKLS